MRDLRASPTTKSGVFGASAFSLIPRFPGYLSKSRGEVVRQPEIRVYYWRGVPNFGDALAAPLLTRFSDVKATWSPIDAAQVTTSGSGLEHIPAGWGGLVAGSGRLVEGSRVHLQRAELMAVRGPLTVLKMRRPGCVLSDPRLHADELRTVRTHDIRPELLPALYIDLLRR